MNNLTAAFQKNYFLSSPALAHILQKHGNGPLMPKGVSQFSISIPEIIGLLREAANHRLLAIPGSNHFRRVIIAGTMVGYDHCGFRTCIYTIVTNRKGRILTAFPGYTRIT
jgi:hypothetical protein